MPHEIEKEIIEQWKEAGHAKAEEDSVLFPEGREVYVVNTDGVTYMSRGVVMRKSRLCEMGMIWVALDGDPFTQRVIQVNRCQLLFAKPKTMFDVDGEDVIDGAFRYRLMSL